jgi:hypothetical protein
MHLGKEWGGSRMLVEKNQKIICIVVFRIVDIDFNATNIFIQHLPEIQKEALVVSTIGMMVNNVGLVPVTHIWEYTMDFPDVHPTLN